MGASTFEIRTLEFCGFWDAARYGRQGIACEIGDCEGAIEPFASFGLVSDGVLHPIGKIQPLLIGWNLPDEVESSRSG